MVKVVTHAVVHAAKAMLWNRIKLGVIILACLSVPQLHEVLAESDRAMAVVKDLFGDDPKVCRLQ